MLGNPQLGIADRDKPLPEVTDDHGNRLYCLSICDGCGGYYAIQCPCGFRPGGRYNPVNDGVGFAKKKTKLNKEVSHGTQDIK